MRAGALMRQTAFCQRAARSWAHARPVPGARDERGATATLGLSSGSRTAKHSSSLCESRMDVMITGTPSGVPFVRQCNGACATVSRLRATAARAIDLRSGIGPRQCLFCCFVLIYRHECSFITHRVRI